MDGNLDALTTVFTEFYYWVTVVFMFLIHVGFCMYEVGASRRRNHMHTLMKNIMIIPLVTVTFFFFGWWIYWAFPGFPFWGGLNLEAGAANLPWSETMGTNLGDRITGVFWGFRRGDRAYSLKRALGPCRADRIGLLDHRRRLGLALCRLDGA